MDKEGSLESRVLQLENKFSVVMEKLEKIESSCNNMDSHIQFINDVYKKVQKPLYWICDRVNYMTGYKLTASDNSENSLKSTINDQD
mgnify:CR=1 FL=1|tara:strand:+ start:197 stop:457 length:261 start_codon:yes stop_codon:yes gene_type:complete